MGRRALLESLISAKPPRRLPSAFQEVEYLESTGTQYIDSGVVQTTIPKIEVELLVPSVLTGKGIFGQTRSNYCFEATFNNRVLYYRFASYQAHAVEFSQKENEWVNYSFSNQVIQDDVVIYNAETWDFSGNTQSILLFKDHNSYSAIKTKKWKIYINGILVRDFVPCYRKADGVAGLYDLANDVFYTNAGTGEFICGKPIIDDAYQLVEYIESHGEERIDTGVNITSDIKVEFDFMMPDASKNAYAGSISRNYIQGYMTGYAFHYMLTENGKIKYCMGDDYSYYELGDVDTNWHTLEVSKSAIVFDGASTSVTTNDFVGGDNYYLFAYNGSFYSSIQYGYTRSSRCRIYNNGAIVRDFVSVYRKSDNEIGLLDLRNNVFYTNAGTGAFTKGPDVI